MAKVKAFVLISTQHQGNEFAGVFVKTLPRIKRLNTPLPLCWQGFQETEMFYSCEPPEEIVEHPMYEPLSLPVPPALNGGSLVQ